MRAYIHKLRAKPEEHRKRILVVALVVSMALVGTIWIYGLGYRWSTDVTPDAVASETKPFSLFAQSVSNTYQNIGASVGNISFMKGTAPAPQTTNQRQINVVPVEQNQNQNQ